MLRTWVDTINAVKAMTPPSLEWGYRSALAQQVKPSAMMLPIAATILIAGSIEKRERTAALIIETSSNKMA